MAIATDKQVQAWADQKSRTFCEALRGIKLSADSQNAAVADIYNACNQGSPTWSDNRHDGPPHLLTPADILSLNTVCVRLSAIFDGTLATDADKIAAVNDLASQWPIVLKTCVRPVL